MHSKERVTNSQSTTFTGDVVTIEVGAAEKAYIIYKVPLMGVSEYFRAAFGSPTLSEGISGEVRNSCYQDISAWC